MSGLRSPIRSPLRSAVVPADDDFRFNFVNQALAILRSYGTNAHVYIPGANGVAVSGLNSGNYTLSDGSTGYSAVDGTTGLVLDGAGSVGAELASSSSITLTGTNAYTSLTMTTSPAVGNTYLVTYSYNLSSGSIQIGSGGSFATGPVHAGPSSGTYTYYAVGNGTTNTTILYCNLGVGTVTNISIKPVTGIHATQSTTANKPALRRGLYNLLTYSNDLSNAAHTKSAVSVSGQKIVEDSTTGNHYLADTLTIAAAPYTHAVRVTAAEHTRVLLRENSVTGSASTFDLSNGTVLGNENGASGSIIAVGDGSYICATTRTFSAGSTQFGVFLVPNAGTNFVSCSYAGNGSAGLTVNQIGLFAGTLTAAQILAEGGIPLTTSTAASNTAAGRYSWQFDGVNDGLKMESAAWTYSDDHCVIAGANCVNVGAAHNNWLAAPASDVNPGTAKRIGALAYDATTSSVQASWYDGVTYVHPEYAYPQGATFVATAVQRSSVGYLRVNGVQRGSGSTAAVTAFTPSKGAIGNDYASITGPFFGGAIGPVIVIKGTISDADLLTLERWVASMTPAAPTF